MTKIKPQSVINMEIPLTTVEIVVSIGYHKSILSRPRFVPVYSRKAEFTRLDLNEKRHLDEFDCKQFESQLYQLIRDVNQLMLVDKEDYELWLKLNK